MRSTLPGTGLGLSYGSSGVYLGGDYTKDRNLDRCESVRLIVQALSAAKEDGYEMAFDVGNSYVLPYASHLLNVPAGSSGYRLEKETVPFVQMVLHGRLNLVRERVFHFVIAMI